MIRIFKDDHKYFIFKHAPIKCFKGMKVNNQKIHTPTQNDSLKHVLLDGDAKNLFIWPSMIMLLSES